MPNLMIIKPLATAVFGGVAVLTLTLADTAQAQWSNNGNRGGRNGWSGGRNNGWNRPAQWLGSISIDNSNTEPVIVYPVYPYYFGPFWGGFYASPYWKVGYYKGRYYGWR